MTRTIRHAGPSAEGTRQEEKDGRSGRKQARSGPPSREFTVSKKLSWVLRHGAKKEGLQMDEGGWVKVNDLVRSEKQLL